MISARRGRAPAPRRYAEGTKVPVATTRAEIEKLVTQHGATRFASGWEGESASILFDMRDRRLRFVIDLRSPPTLARVKSRAMDERIAKEGRRKWRALLLVIKAKLESVASGVETFDDAFLANIVLPTGNTFGEWARFQIADIYKGGHLTGEMPRLLTDGRGGTNP